MRFSDNRMGVVAIFKNPMNGELQEVCYITGLREESCVEQAKSLEESGYHLENLVITNIKETYYRAKLKSGLAVLRNTSKMYAEELKEMRCRTTRNVLEETAQLMHDYEETLMDIVAKRATRLMNIYEIEVTDELALQCVDHYNLKHLSA